MSFAIGFILGFVIHWLYLWKISFKIEETPMWFWMNGKYVKCFQFGYLGIDFSRKKIL